MRGFIIHNYNTDLALASIDNPDAGYLLARPPTYDGQPAGSNGLFGDALLAGRLRSYLRLDLLLQLLKTLLTAESVFGR